jgi:hypothetical protein
VAATLGADRLGSFSGCLVRLDNVSEVAIMKTKDLLFEIEVILMLILGFGLFFTLLYMAGITL